MSGPQTSFYKRMAQAPETDLELRDHWEAVYRDKALARVSWHQDRPDVSLSFISRAGVGVDARILDVGAGTSTLVDNLLDLGYRHLGVLDISSTAIELTRRRLGDRAEGVEWFVSSVTEFVTPHPWDVWHDRAVLHFLTEDSDRAEYRRRLERSVAARAFEPEGPTRCSGLDVRRNSVEELTACVGPDFSLEHHEIVEHTTPGGGGQQFLFGLFKRTSGSP